MCPTHVENIGGGLVGPKDHPCPTLISEKHNVLSDVEQKVKRLGLARHIAKNCLYIKYFGPDQAYFVALSINSFSRASFLTCILKKNNS